MDSPWDRIGDIVPDISNPYDIIVELFKPMHAKTNSTVKFKLQRVNYFPEEISFSFGMDLPKDHPDFGYDPVGAQERAEFRYRLLLYPVRDSDVEYELFKVKYPVFFYPLRIYIEQKAFPELVDFFSEKRLIVNDEIALREVTNRIIASEATIKIIRRLMAI